MSAPSRLHEHRRSQLLTLLRLSGYMNRAHLQWWLRPDVAVASPSLRALVIGDAKATEHPHDHKTMRRIVAY